MKPVLCAAFLVFTALGAFAFPGEEPSYVSAEMKALRTDLGSQSLGSLTVGELVPVAERLDVARQKDGYVLAAGTASFLWPGAGQFLTGDWAGGTLQTAFHVGLSAGSLVWAHSLLPADLRVDSLNYLRTNQTDLKARWMSHTLEDYLPALGALAAGGAVDLVLRYWSSREARTTAKARIEAGTVTFEPRFEGAWGGWGRHGAGDGYFSLGLGLRY